MGRFWDGFGRPGAPLGHDSQRLLRPLGDPGCWEDPGRLWCELGASLERLGTSLGQLGALWGVTWGDLEHLWENLQRLWGLGVPLG